MFRKYSALISGNIADALTDFTGGFVELYKFHNANDDMPNMYTLLDSCLVNNGLAVAVRLSSKSFLIHYFASTMSLMFVYSFKTVDAPFTSNYGLINKHAYNITDIKKVSACKKATI